ncbi:hypothetical protein Tco_1351533 [Tanacetum coccineum]
MGRDTIQLDDAVSTIFREYLLEFTSEYGIPEDLHPEFPGPEDTIVDFSKGKVEMDLFNLISAPNSAKVKTGTRPRTAYEVSLLTATANRVIDMDTTGASGSSVKPSTVEKSSLDFADEDFLRQILRESGQRSRYMMNCHEKSPCPPMNKRRKQMCRKRANDEAEANAPPKVLRKDHVSTPTHSAYGGKSIAAMGLGAGSISSTPSAQGAPTAVKSVSDPDPLSYAKPQPYPEQDIAQGTATEIPTEHVATIEVNVQLSVGSPESGRSTSVPSVVGSPGGIYQPGWGVTNDCRLDTPAACQDTVDHIVPPGYFSELRHLPNADFLSQYNMNLARQVAMGSQLRLRFEQEVRLLKKARAKKPGTENKDPSERGRINKLDQELNPFSRLRETECMASSMDFDEELYPHADSDRGIVDGLIRNGRAAVMKCAESTELRQVFANVVSVGIAKGMSEGLKYGVKHGKAGRDLVDVENNTRANDKDSQKSLLRLERILNIRWWINWRE